MRAQYLDGTGPMRGLHSNLTFECEHSDPCLLHEAILQGVRPALHLFGSRGLHHHRRDQGKAEQGYLTHRRLFCLKHLVVFLLGLV